MLNGFHLLSTSVYSHLLHTRNTDGAKLRLYVMHGTEHEQHTVVRRRGGKTKVAKERADKEVGKGHIGYSHGSLQYVDWEKWKGEITSPVSSLLHVAWLGAGRLAVSSSQAPPPHTPHHSAHCTSPPLHT